MNAPAEREAAPTRGKGRRPHGPYRQILIASNRGPVSFVRDDQGRVDPRRGAGGLVTALTGALQLSGGMWIASAMTEEDRAQAASGRIGIPPSEGAGARSGFNVRYLAFDPETYDRFYNAVSNRILWFVHHYLWEVAREPRFDAETRRAWQAYREVNRTFARALAEEGGSSGDPAYLVQDYHLALVPAMLREARPAARIAHFSHIPFAGPGYLRILPEGMRHELLAGYLGADVIGFHARSWAENFLLCCRLLPGARVDQAHSRVAWAGRTIRVDVFPISIDVESIRSQAASPATRRARRRLEEWLGHARLVLRVDRTELSKNILRGLLSFETFVREHPRWRRRVLHLALLNPSREAIPEYGAYLRECLRTARRINRDLGEPGWEPIRVSVKDDYSTALAAYGIYDVLVVNPVFDGMNLVAKEGPLLNQRDGVLVLSENAGAFAELGRHAVGVNPFDVAATARAIGTGLGMGRAERRIRAEALRAAVIANPLDRWVEAQLDALEAASSNRT